MEKSLEKVQSKFTDFQQQSAPNVAKAEHKKELIKIKDQKKKAHKDKKKKEMACEKELPRRKPQDVINIHQDFMAIPDTKKIFKTE